MLGDLLGRLLLGLARREARAQPQVTAEEDAVPIGQRTVEGLSNATGHQGAVSDYAPPSATQVGRSQTLGQFTGGYR